MKRNYFNFRMSYANLYDLGKVKIAFAKRDAMRFNEFGYNSDKITQIETDIEQLRTISRDGELLAEQVLTTDRRNKKDVEVRNFIRKIQVRLDQVYSSTNPTFLSIFKISDLSKISYSELVLEGERIVRMARNYMTELEAVGLTEILISELETMITELHDVALEMKIKVTERDYSAGERLQTANNVYNSIFKLCQIGKTIWLNENESHYNDYIIYETQNSVSLPEEEILETADTLETEFYPDNG